MSVMDEGLGELLGVYQQARIFNQHLWVITVDHGKAPNVDVVDGGVVLEASVRAAGYMEARNTLFCLKRHRGRQSVPREQISPG